MTLRPPNASSASRESSLPVQSSANRKGARKGASAVQLAPATGNMHEHTNNETRDSLHVDDAGMLAALLRLHPGARWPVGVALKGGKLTHNISRLPESEVKKWLQSKFIRLHSVLYSLGLLPLSEFCERRTAKTFDRACISRLGFQIFFRTHADLVPQDSTCMDWGPKQTGGYSHLVPGCTKSRYWTYDFKPDVGLRLDKANRVATGDLTMSHSFVGMLQLDMVMCNQVFEHVRQPFDAAKSLFHMIRPGGLLLWSAPFLERSHAVPKDFFRYTGDGAREVLQSAGFKVEVMKRVGNSRITSGYLLGFGTGDFGGPAKMSHNLIQEFGEDTPTHPNKWLYISTVIVARRPEG